MNPQDEDGTGDEDLGSVYIDLGFPSLMQRALWAVQRSSQGDFASMDAVLYSAMAAEAFPNDFGHMAATFSSEDTDVPALVAAGQILPQLEDQQVRTKTKYLILYYVLKNESFPTGGQLWADFGFLLDLRNEIAHRKPDNVEWKGNTRTRSTRRTKLIDGLRLRKLTNRPPGAEPDDWGFILEDGDVVGRWALNTTKNIVQFVARAVPASRFRVSYIESFLGPNSMMNKPDWPA